ncbi:hypothetical protein [Catenovulum maritimum]|nr:hypothetical protein [Catenovulum maritimum]
MNKINPTSQFKSSVFGLVTLMTIASCGSVADQKGPVAAATNKQASVADKELSLHVPKAPEGVQTRFGTDTRDYDGPEIGYFENKVFDDKPEVLFAEDSFSDATNDTNRLKSALKRASREKNGGVVILQPAKNSANVRFSLAHIQVPSNTRIEISPDVILEMRGIKEEKAANSRFLFSFGRSNGPRNLLKERVKNVEVRSTDPTRNFTIDARTNMPISYGKMVGGNGNGDVNLTRAISFAYFYVQNFAVSNATILDNHTESVSVQMFSDCDYKDGVYAYRFGSKPVFLQDRYQTNPKGAANKNKPMNPANIPLPMNEKGEFIDSEGKVIPDMFAIKRNPTYARTPIKGSIKNIKAINAHTGYGAVQVYGGDWIEIDNIEAFNGIAVRVEAGNGTNRDNYNRAGPYYTSANKIKISNVKVTNGFTGVWLKPHAKIMKDISVENIEAIDSATALLVGKGTFACKTKCRDLTRGRINNLTIKGNISFRQTIYDEPVSEVGNVATFFLSEFNRAHLAKKVGKDINRISRNDLLKNKSGTRWYLMFPAAPIFALNQLSETEIGDETSRGGDFAVDYSQVKIVQEGLPLVEGETERPNILYRQDMHTPDGKVATDFINK